MTSLHVQYFYNNPFVKYLHGYNNQFVTRKSGRTFSEKVLEMIKKIILAVAAPLVYVGLGFMALVNYSISHCAKVVKCTGEINFTKDEEKPTGFEPLVSLKKYGCKTANDAIEYAIHNKLTGADLSDFPDLEESHLERLFENCPNLDQLYFCSDKIRILSTKARNLKELYCNRCQNLKSLSKLPLLQKLNCSECQNLKNLSRLPHVKVLNCSFCPCLQRLPDLPQVQMLFCSGCELLQRLPALPHVKVLNCSFCSNLRSLPDLTHVKELSCCCCQKLQNLPNLTQVQKLDCSGCNNLQSLPELPRVKKLFCKGCENLHRLPELLRIKELHCNWRKLIFHSK